MNRGSDSVLSVYSDARAEYTKQLCVFLVPAYFQFYIDLLEKSKQQMVNEPKKALWQFQNLLNEIHDWNMEKVHHEIQQIHSNCGCDYLEDLITAVFIAHTKVLAAIRISSKNKKLDISIPKVEHFLFKVLCETSKLLWSSTYLFRDGISSIEKQQNYRTIETLLNEGILQAVRNLVPVKTILKDFMNFDNSDAAEDDSDDESHSDKPDSTIKPAESNEDQPTDELDMKSSLNESTLKQTEEESKKENNDSPSIESVPESKTIADLVQSINDIPTTTSMNEIVLPTPEMTPSQNTSEGTPQMIIIDEKPSVRFGQFDAIFNLDHPSESDMIYEPKDGEDHIPDLEIIDESGINLSEGIDFDDLSNTPENIGEDEYETL
jgi:hypothetical protein